VSGRLSDLHRTAFITGASTGLGRAFAEMLKLQAGRLGSLVRANGIMKTMRRI